MSITYHTIYTLTPKHTHIHTSIYIIHPPTHSPHLVHSRLMLQHIKLDCLGQRAALTHRYHVTFTDILRGERGGDRVGQGGGYIIYIIHNTHTQTNTDITVNKYKSNILINKQINKQKKYPPPIILIYTNRRGGIEGEKRDGRVPGSRGSSGPTCWRDASRNYGGGRVRNMLIMMIIIIIIITLQPFIYYLSIYVIQWWGGRGSSHRLYLRTYWRQSLRITTVRFI